MQGVQIGEDGLLLNALGLQMQQQIGLTALRVANQTADSVQAFPVELVFQDRRLTARRPGSSDAGFEGETALVEEG